MLSELRAAWGLALAVQLTAAAPALCNDAEFAACLRQGLTVGWESSFRALRPAEELLGKARRVKATDARAPFALALVQMKHRRYDDAKASVTAALELDRKWITAHQADIFLTVLLKQHRAALPKLENLASLIATAAEAEELSVAEMQSASQFVGQMIGYLATSASEAPQLEVEATRQRVLAALPVSCREMFDAGREAVDEQFTELFLDREQLQQDAQQSELQERGRIAAQLLAQRDALAEQRKAIEEKRDAATAQWEAENAAVNEARGPVEAKLASVQAAMLPVERRIADLDAAISQYITLLQTERDPNRRFALRVEIDRLTAAIGREQANYQVLRTQADNLRGELTVLEARRKTARDRYAATNSALAEQATELVSAEKKLVNQWERNQRPVVGNTAAVTSRSAKVKALTTYYEFPLEAERQRLLQSLE
jgi:chromosome segregation ATPase